MHKRTSAFLAPLLLRWSILLLLLPCGLTAREGMWIPSLLKQLNESDLRSMGLIIPVEELFNGESGGLNDAIVQFGGGCTGEIVSDQGLLFTNHHCGFSQIQALSTLEKNYLEKGYWAKSLEDELPCPGLTVTFIRDIREVSATVLEKVYPGMSEEQRTKSVKEAVDSLEKASANDGRKAMIRPFYGGNRYFLFITETFRDVRLAGTPPLSVGNFGGETDNWVWPRHTGDFSVFRIYADKDNNPADFSKDNRPYKPKRYLKVSTEGIKEGDFTMVYGFPGRTQQYLTSASIRLIEQQTNPNRIALRDIRMDLYREAMRDNDTVRLQYAGKFKSLANAYKKWQGELIGLRKADVYKRKKETESAASGETETILESLNRTVEASAGYNNALDYYTEGYAAIELTAQAAKMKTLLDLCAAERPDEEKIRKESAKLSVEMESFYRNYSAMLDRQVAAAVLATCSTRIPDSLQPPFISDYRKNPVKFLDLLYNRSLLTQPDRLQTLLKDFSSKQGKQLKEDPAWKFQLQLNSSRTEKIDRPLNKLNETIAACQRRWIAYLSATRSTPMAADANSTLRVSYGKTEGLQPKDGLKYGWQTFGEGILEKSMTGEEDYLLDPELRKLLEAGAYGPYAQGGKLPVAFIASNHTTGGNSGSPVLDAKGRLIGINFDRIWEGVMSDLYYDPALSRNVAVDIRYVLFIIDRLGGCERLVQEIGAD